MGHAGLLITSQFNLETILLARNSGPCVAIVMHRQSQNLRAYFSCKSTACYS